MKVVVTTAGKWYRRAVNSYLPRLVDTSLESALRSHPAVMLNGPRACGKTTTAQRVTERIVRLDVAAEATPFRADPDTALALHRGTRLLLDEWQEVPEILGAIKRACDAGARPGSFTLTGSVRAGTDRAGWPGTGRIVDLEMGPLSEAEINSAPPGHFMGRLLAGETMPPPADAPTYVDYVDIALAGGFPEARLTLDPADRGLWYRSYTNRIIDRDVAEILRRGDPDRARAYLEAFALHASQVCDHASIFRIAGVARKTAERYEDIFTRLHVIERVPAWHNNRLRELVHMPKRFLIDPALIAPAARVSREQILSDGRLLGAVIENLVYSQLSVEIGARHPDISIRHLRTGGGRHEIDLVLTVGHRRAVGIEVKTSAAPDRSDARHLMWMRDEMGDDFLRGIIFHTGPASFRLDDRIEAVPISALWS